MTAPMQPDGQVSDAQEAEPLGVYTETLARLYWRQGYLDKALRIYRHLAAEEPNVIHFQDQINALIQEQDASSEGGLTTPVDTRLEVSDPVSLSDAGTALQAQQVVAELERWLHCLQRQQQR